MNIGGIEIGPDQPCRVIAEISNSHNGDLKTCLRLIRECAEAGADFVKFQCYTPDELVALRGDGPAPDPWGADGWSMHDLYTRAQTPHAWFPEIADHCRTRAMVPWFSSVFGSESLKLLESLDCPAYKISALDADTDFARTLIASNYDADGTTLVSVREAPQPNTMAATLYGVMALHCPEGYPQTEGYDPDIAPGFSYHGTVWQTVWNAAIKGAQLVEVHVQLDDEPSELEAGVSLTVSQLRTLCKAVKIVPRRTK